MTQYYELHITMITFGSFDAVRVAVEQCGCRFSAIAGDANLGDGVKLYATKQFSTKRWTDASCVAALNDTADELAKVVGVEVLRRKVERVIYDDRSSKVRAACDGACPECHAESTGPFVRNDFNVAFNAYNRALRKDANDTLSALNDAFETLA